MWSTPQGLAPSGRFWRSANVPGIYKTNQARAEVSAGLIKSERLTVADHGHGGQRTLEPETMLMFIPEMISPFTRPGLRLILR